MTDPHHDHNDDDHHEHEHDEGHRPLPVSAVLDWIEAAAASGGEGIG